MLINSLEGPLVKRFLKKFTIVLFLWLTKFFSWVLSIAPLPILKNKSKLVFNLKKTTNSFNTIIKRRGEGGRMSTKNERGYNL